MSRYDELRAMREARFARPTAPAKETKLSENVTKLETKLINRADVTKLDTVPSRTDGRGVWRAGGRGRPPLGRIAMTSTERVRRHRSLRGGAVACHENRE
jgi:hypothetical protein